MGKQAQECIHLGASMGWLFAPARSVALGNIEPSHDAVTGVGNATAPCPLATPASIATTGIARGKSSPPYLPPAATFSWSRIVWTLPCFYCYHYFIYFIQLRDTRSSSYSETSMNHTTCDKSLVCVGFSFASSSWWMRFFFREDCS